MNPHLTWPGILPVMGMQKQSLLCFSTTVRFCHHFGFVFQMTSQKARLLVITSVLNFILIFFLSVSYRVVSTITLLQGIASTIQRWPTRNMANKIHQGTRLVRVGGVQVNIHDFRSSISLQDIVHYLFYFRDLISLKSNFDENAGVIFPFSEKIAAEWYESKVRKIVKRSGLIDYALELVNLAIKNNIPVGASF